MSKAFEMRFFYGFLGVLKSFACVWVVDLARMTVSVQPLSRIKIKNKIDKKSCFL